MRTFTSIEIRLAYNGDIYTVPSIFNTVKFKGCAVISRHLDTARLLVMGEGEGPPMYNSPLSILNKKLGFHLVREGHAIHDDDQYIDLVADEMGDTYGLYVFERMM